MSPHPPAAPVPGAPLLASAAPAHAKAAKSLYAGQLARLTSKADEDAALLDHTKEFLRRKLEIERDAAEKIDKLVRSYNKIAAAAAASASGAGTGKSPAAVAAAAAENDEGDAATGDAASDGVPEIKPTLRVFNALLAESESRAKRTLALCDSLASTVVDPARDFVREKQAATAKSAELWRTTQDALVGTLFTLSERRREYEDAAKHAESAARKHADLLAGKTSMLSSVKAAFSSVSDEERLSKSALKAKNAARRLVDARNAYLLALASNNAAQAQYWATELPAFMHRLDGEFHPTFAQTVANSASAEADALEQARAAAAAVVDATGEIDRDVEQARFLHLHAKVFPGAAVFAHEPAASDVAPAELVLDEVSKVVLATALMDLKKRRQIAAKEWDKTTKEIAGLEQMAKVYEKNPEFGNATNPLDSKLALELQAVHLSVQLKAIEAQVAALEDAGVSVTSAVSDLTLTSATIDAAKLAGMDSLVSPSTSVGAGLAGLSAATGPVSSPPTPSRSGTATAPRDPPGIGKARVLFAYTAQEPSELSVREGQVLTLLEPDVEGWTKAAVPGTSTVGFVPSGYIVTLSSTNTTPITSPAPTRRPTNASASSAAAAAAARKAASPPPGAVTVTALFDYTPQESGELAFRAGDALRVLDRGATADESGGTTPEWWLGQNTRTGEQGLFPYVFTQGWDAVVAAATTTAAVTASSPRARSASSTTRSVRRMSTAGDSASVRSGGTGASVPPLPTPRANGSSGEMRVTALFEYASTCDGEMSMAVGDTIAVTSTRTGSDAWWAGRNLRTGAAGQFPKDYTAPV
ncbi:hypothetical protein H9P43_003520 [Blastocladiella emersonii ATCC 22665]|nr:hypothetical protein H9P43_003520 [Blastocladiella emersonii ATCC 22665]